MKILFDTSPLKSGHKDRGIGRYTQELLNYLKSRPEVELISSQSIQSPDLIHYPSFDLFRPTISLLTKKPFIITIHDLIPLRYPQGYPIGLKARLALVWQKLMAKKAAAILTDSHESRADVCRYFGIDPAKVIVIPLAVSSDFYPVSRKDAQKYLLKYHIDTPYILYVGDINYNKNLPELIQALAHLPSSIKLVCLGRNFRPQPIPEWRSIQDAIDTHDLQSRIVFIHDLDQTKKQTLRSIYSQALCYVQPSLTEGFGLPVLEAMACGTLVLCSRTPALKEVGSHVAWYVDPNQNDLALGIKKILRLSPSKRKEKRREGMIWAKGFSWERTGRGTLLIYQKVMSGQIK